MDLVLPQVSLLADRLDRRASFEVHRSSRGLGCQGLSLEQVPSLALGSFMPTTIARDDRDVDAWSVAIGRTISSTPELYCSPLQLLRGLTLEETPNAAQFGWRSAGAGYLVVCGPCFGLRTQTSKIR